MIPCCGVFLYCLHLIWDTANIPLAVSVTTDDVQDFNRPGPSVTPRVMISLSHSLNDWVNL